MELQPDLLLAQTRTIWLLQHMPSMVFVFCFGATVGSFINVVIYRLPEGMSVISPPSRCPICGAKLKFFRENLPILGWFLIRGKCRYCRAPVPARYMFVELMMALLFLGLYLVLYVTPPDMPWLGRIGGEWWYDHGFWRSVPAFVAIAFMLAGLWAMTVIDAKTFTIPIQIPVFVTVAAFIAFPLQAILPLLAVRRTPNQTWPIPTTDWQWFLVAALGMLGIVIAMALLKTGRLRYSFYDYEHYVEEGETLGEYPHGRREMGIELLFLLPCIAGLMLGGFFGSLLPTTPPPLILQALGGSLLGYLVGGGLVWAIRIVGTLAFGREAMGMGDVHLLAAVGAVLGWFDPILVFFIAPFSGLLWTATAGILRVKHRELPYGPHLAAATVLVILGRPGLVRAWDIWMPMPFPEGGRQVEPAEIPQSAPPFAPSQARREVEGIGCLWIS